NDENVRAARGRRGIASRLTQVLRGERVAGDLVDLSTNSAEDDAWRHRWNRVNSRPVSGYRRGFGLCKVVFAPWSVLEPGNVKVSVDASSGNNMRNPTERVNQRIARSLWASRCARHVDAKPGAIKP